MTLAALTEVIANVDTMGGDPLSEILAPSEIRAISEAVLASGLADTAQSRIPAYPAHLSWMAAVPAHMHDCFSS